MAIQFGHIVRLRNDRGFGFVRGNDGREMFFHLRDVRGSRLFNELQPGDAVSFEEDFSPKGPCARNVEAIPTE